MYHLLYHPSDSPVTGLVPPLNSQEKALLGFVWSCPQSPIQTSISSWIGWKRVWNLKPSRSKKKSVGTWKLAVAKKSSWDLKVGRSKMISVTNGCHSHTPLPTAKSDLTHTYHQMTCTTNLCHTITDNHQHFTMTKLFQFQWPVQERRSL